MKESHPKKIRMTRMAKAKENALNMKIQIISSENAQNYQETIIKEPSLVEHGVIAMKMEKKRLGMKNVLWLKHLMSASRATAAPRGRRRGGLTGRGGGGQGNEVIDGVDGVPDFSTIIAQQLQNLLSTILARQQSREP
ncbi:hypothetical protein Tco_0876243 [Tanacetum coccineum]|uniref:Uncharacterized protein n=1 Tax=Tanacetum coccineum TaxID=301880 RepID=A0ABQ5BUI5_9ASTR